MLRRLLTHPSGRVPPAIAAAPPDATAQAESHQRAAHLHHERGEYAEAKRYCELALAADPDHTPAHAMLASIALPGADYRELLGRIHAHLRPRTYVEIGVQKGASFRLADSSTLAIGVDPEPQYAPPAGGNHRLFRQTSDAFFADHDLRSLLRGLPVDLAFIDGMHRFEFALRDFMRLEPYCDAGATILVHDCFPLDERTAARERSTTFWSGDVWRFVLVLKQHRPDLAVHTIGAPPTGLAIIRNLDPASRVIAANLDAICAEFLAVGFETIAEEKPARLNLVPNDWDEVRALLRKVPN